MQSAPGDSLAPFRSRSSSSPSTPTSAHSPASTTTDSSTPQPYHNDSNNLDDIWGSAPTEDNGDDFSTTNPSDIPRIRSIHSTAGYRDGIASAREAAAQPGFDEGYLLGAALGIRAGRLLGWMDGIVRGRDRERDWKESGMALASLRAEMRRELALESLLGRRWIAEDGTWAWEVGNDSGIDDQTSVDAAVQVLPFGKAATGPLSSGEDSGSTAAILPAADRSLHQEEKEMQRSKAEQEEREEEYSDATISIDTVARCHPLLDKWQRTMEAILQAADVQEGPVGILAPLPETIVQPK